MRQPRGRSIDSPEDTDENRLIVTFSQHHNSQGTEAEEVLHEMANSQYQFGQNVHHVHQVSSNLYLFAKILFYSKSLFFILFSYLLLSNPGDNTLMEI